jgi:hypothetical protein
MLGEIDLYYTSKNTVPGSASLKTSHFAGPVGNREASPVRKRVHPLLNVHILQTSQYKRNKGYETKIQKAATSPRRQTKYFWSMLTFHG